MKLSIRIFSILGFVLLFVILYFTIGHFVIERGVFYTPMFSWEKDIPFLPWTFFVYCWVYIVPTAAFLFLPSKESLVVMLKTFSVALIIHGIVWFFYPVKFVLRPEINLEGAGFLLIACNALFQLDTPPINCFPSLHVSYAFLTYFIYHVFRPRLAPYFLVVAIAISLSTLTFKQHYVVDVITGFFLALILKWIFIKKR